MEIGSIFEINPVDLFSSDEGDIRLPFMEGAEWNIQFFNTCRSAIEAYFHSRQGVSRVWVPSFICSSVIDAITRAGMTIKYYPIDRSLQIDIEFLYQSDIKEGDVLYCLQYFGVSASQKEMKMICDFRDKGVLIVEDLTMALLSDNEESFAFGDIIFGSIRKWCGIPDGAFIASKNALPLMNKEKASYDYTLYYFTAQILKSLYLSCPAKYDKEKFLSFSNLGIESLFSDYTIREMSHISSRILRTIDWGECCIKRRENYKLLYGLLKEIPTIKIIGNCSKKNLPIGMFILTENRDGLLNYLISKDIYCNVHWRQNEATEQFVDSMYLSRHCLTIPCDHRYGENHMQYIYRTIKQYFGGEYAKSI